MNRGIRRVLGVLQVGGGFVGLSMIASQLNSNAPPGTVEWLLFSALFAFGLCAGVGLLEGSRRGRQASIAYWWLQLPAFSSPFASWSLWSGAMFSAGANFSSPQIGIQADWGAGFDLAGAGSAPTVVAVNLCAALALYLLHGREREPVAGGNPSSSTEIQ